MFSVAQKRNTCWQKIVPAVYKYMLYWLKTFCVARKIPWCSTKTKVFGTVQHRIASPKVWEWYWVHWNLSYIKRSRCFTTGPRKKKSMFVVTRSSLLKSTDPKLFFARIWKNYRRPTCQVAKNIFTKCFFQF